jgi:hypothetical protein
MNVSASLHLFCAVRRVCCHLWSAWLYHTFTHYLISSIRIGKGVMNHKTRVIIFSTFFLKILLILRKIQRDIIINVYGSSWKLHVILVRF